MIYREAPIVFDIDGRSCVWYNEKGDFFIADPEGDVMIVIDDGGGMTRCRKETARFRKEAK